MDSHLPIDLINGIHVSTESDRAELLMNEWRISCSLQLEEQNLTIEVEMLELDKQWFKWLKSSQQEDRELDTRFKYECLKLETESFTLELKYSCTGKLVLITTQRSVWALCRHFYPRCFLQKHNYHFYLLFSFQQALIFIRIFKCIEKLY